MKKLIQTLCILAFLTSCGGKTFEDRCVVAKKSHSKPKSASVSPSVSSRGYVSASLNGLGSSAKYFVELDCNENGYFLIEDRKLWEQTKQGKSYNFKVSNGAFSNSAKLLKSQN